MPTPPVEHDTVNTVTFNKNWFLEGLGSRRLNYKLLKKIADTNPESLLNTFEQELEGLLSKKDSEIRTLQAEVEALNKQIADLKASAASHAAPMPAVPPVSSEASAGSSGTSASK